MVQMLAHVFRVFLIRIVQDRHQFVIHSQIHVVLANQMQIVMVTLHFAHQMVLILVHVCPHAPTKQARAAAGEALPASHAPLSFRNRFF